MKKLRPPVQSNNSKHGLATQHMLLLQHEPAELRVVSFERCNVKPRRVPMMHVVLRSYTHIHAQI